MGVNSRSGTFTGTGNGDSLTLRNGGGVLTLSGTFVGTVKLQRKGDDGTFRDVTDNSGNVVTFTTAGTFTINEAHKAEYRPVCSAYTSGTITWTLEW